MLYRFDAYVLDTDRRELRRGDGSIAIEPQVFDLLVYLIRHRERRHQGRFVGRNLAWPDRVGVGTDHTDQFGAPRSATTARASG